MFSKIKKTLQYLIIGGAFFFNKANPADTFIRGDINQNGRINISDSIAILDYLYRGKPLRCLDAADVDDDGEIKINDAISHLRYLFSQGPPPAYPFPEEDYDLTRDRLHCNNEMDLEKIIELTSDISIEIQEHRPKNNPAYYIFKETIFAPVRIINSYNVILNGDRYRLEHSSLKGNIQIKQSNNITLKNIIIESTDTAIILNNSISSKIENCFIKGKTGISSTDSHGVFLYRSDIIASRGIIMDNSNDWRSYLTDIDFYEYALYFIGSRGNNFIENRIFSLNSQAGILIEGPSDNIIRDSSITQIFFPQSSVTFFPSSSGTFTLINTPFRNKISFDKESEAKLQVYWYLIANVSENKNPVKDAKIEIYDINNNRAFSSSTNNEGKIGAMLLSYTQDRNNINTSYPYQVFISKQGYKPKQDTINELTESINKEWVLEKQ